MSTNTGGTGNTGTGSTGTGNTGTGSTGSSTTGTGSGSTGTTTGSTGTGSAGTGSGGTGTGSGSTGTGTGSTGTGSGGTGTGGTTTGRTGTTSGGAGTGTGTGKGTGTSTTSTGTGKGTGTSSSGGGSTSKSGGTTQATQHVYSIPDTPTAPNVSNIEKLKGLENYNGWRTMILAALQFAKAEKALGKIVTKPLQVGSPTYDSEKAKYQIWKQKDAAAQMAILHSVQPMILTHISDLQTSHEMWELLARMFSDKSEANLTILLSKYHHYNPKKGSNALRVYEDLHKLWVNLRNAGDTTVTETALTAKIIICLSKEYDSEKAIWANSIPPAERTMSRLFTMLQIADHHKRAANDMEKGQTSVKAASQGGSKLSNSGRNQKTKRPEAGKQKFSGECYNCGKKGHRAIDCRSPKKEKPSSSKQNSKSKSETVTKAASDDEDKPKENSKKGESAVIKPPKTGKKSVKEKSAKMVLSFAKYHLEKAPSYYEAFEGIPNKDIWTLDSGSDDHMCNNLKWFVEESYTRYDNPQSYTTATGDEFLVLGEGPVRGNAFINGRWKGFTLQDVKYSPTCSNLFSNGTFLRDQPGWEYRGTDAGVIYRKEDSNELGPTAVPGPNNKTCYLLFKERLRKRVCGVRPLTRRLNAMDWHRMLGHMSLDKMRKTAKLEALAGLEISQLTGDINCRECKLEKFVSLPCKEREPPTKYLPGEKFHVDITGDYGTVSIHGNKYAILFKDDRTVWKYISFVRSKSDVAEKVKDFIRMIQRQTSVKVKVLKTDGGTEYKPLNSFLKRHGIVHRVTPPYSPQQNGTVERGMREFKDGVRTMLRAANFPKFLWELAASVAVHTLNRAICRRSPDKTPEEHMFGKKPSGANLVPFGTRAYFRNHERKSKTDSPGMEGYLVGYDYDDEKIYRIYVPERRKVYIAVHVRFDYDQVGLPTTHDLRRVESSSDDDPTPTALDKQGSHSSVENSDSDNGNNDSTDDEATADREEVETDESTSDSDASESPGTNGDDEAQNGTSSSSDEEQVETRSHESEEGRQTLSESEDDNQEGILLRNEPENDSTSESGSAHGNDHSDDSEQFHTGNESEGDSEDFNSDHELLHEVHEVEGGQAD